MVAAVGVENPTSRLIAAGGQLARQYSELFGAADFNGWVQATSASTGLTGFFLNANPAVTDLDGAVALDAAVRFVLPFAAEDETTKTELTVINPGSETATATLTLYASDGTQVGSESINLSAKALVRQTLAGLFPDADRTSVSHVEVAGDRVLVAHEVVADFQVSGTGFRRETIALGGRIPTESTRHVLPQFVTGAGWLSFLGLVNTAASAQDVVLTARRDDGTLWDLPANPKTVTLAPNAGWRGRVADLFGITDGASELRAGWIDVTLPAGFVASYIGYGNEATSSFALLSGVEESAASKLQVYSQVAEGGGFFTGLTVVNPSPDPAEIEFFTLLPDGSTVGRTSLTVPANGRVGRLYRELLPASLKQVGGWAYLRSDIEVVGAALFGGTNGFALASVPAESIAADFIPPAQVAAAITGAVRQDGVGVRDVTVSLTGPVTATTKTDGEGRFVFALLPPGAYQLTASRLGAQVAPADRTVELSVENVTDQDFTAGGVVPSEAPALSFITPASVFSGTRLLNVTVLGTNFNPASVVEFNGSRLQTTFVSSVELQAVVSSALLNRVGDAQITVTTPPPGGGTSGAAAFLVIALPDNPLIEGRVSVGSFPAGVAIHPRRKLALVTNEGSDNVSVIDLKIREVIETIEVGRSPGEGIDIHPGLDLAVVANVGSNNVTVIDLTTMTVTKTIDVGRFPIGVAIDTERDLAVVTNGEDGNVSLIHLPTLEVVSQIQVGERPAGVAINSRTGIAVVANRGADTVTLIDLDARSSVSTIGTEGDFPRAVAINETTNVAVVTNANSNAVALIDLETRRFIGTVAVGVGPSGVAIHELTNSAVVSNSGLSLGSSDLGTLTTAEIIDLGGRTLVDSVPVGSTAFGVAVDEASQIAVVANFGSNDVTVIRIPNPTPQVDDVSPKTFPAGGGEFTITVQGSGFLPTSVVTLNGEALPTIYVSPTELQAVISAALLDELLQVSSISLDEGAGQRFAQTNPLQFNIEVINPGPGGGKSPPPSNPGAGQIQPSNSEPVLLSISPTEIETGASELELTLNGNNFNGTSVVDFGGSLHSPFTSTATSMTVVISGSDLQVGVVAVSVGNPPPGGGTTASIPFTVTELSNPVPVVVSVSPQSVPAGSAAVGLSITGSGFIFETEVSIEGETLEATITETSADATLSADLLRTPGKLTGFVENPSPGGGTASFSINVLTQRPSISGFDPTTADAGLESLGVTVTGSNFSLNAFITVDGAEIPTSVISDTQLDGTIPGALLRSPGELAIGATNPSLGGGSADGGNLTVQNPAPVLEALDPALLGFDALPASVVASGRNFLPTSVVEVDGAEVDTTFIDSTSLSFTLGVRASAGVLSVSVVNPDPGGGESEALNVTIGNPAPTIDSVDPTEIGADQLPATITVTGGGFIPESQVELNAPADVGSVSVIDGRTLEFTLAAGTSAGVHTVTVTNPGPGGGTSNGESLRVTNPSPVVSRVRPDSGNATEATDVNVVGANFVDGAEILVDGEAIDTRFNGPTSLSGTVPPSPAGSLSISVQNPGGIESNAVGFSVIELPNPATHIASISPDPSTLKQGDTITVTGTGFIGETEAFLDGQRLNVAILNETTVTIVAPELADGSHTITLTNPPSVGGGGGTASFTFSTGGIVSLQVTLKDVKTNQVISGATLTLGGVSTTTDANGLVQFTSLPIGKPSLEVAPAGYISRTFDQHLLIGTTSIVVYLYPTSVGATDTDGDGIPDAAETNTGIFLSVLDTGTDPNKADSDGDGLSDGVEVLR